MDSRKEDRDVPLLNAVQSRVSADDIVKIIRKHDLELKLENKLMIYALKNYTNLTLKEIGQRIGKGHYSSLSQTVKRLIKQA